MQKWEDLDNLSQADNVKSEEYWMQKYSNDEPFKAPAQMISERNMPMPAQSISSSEISTVKRQKVLNLFL